MAANDTLNEIKSKGILWGFGVFTLVVLTVLIFLGAWWGSEPEQFNVQDEAVKRAEETHSTENMPVGYVYANTWRILPKFFYIKAAVTLPTMSHLPAYFWITFPTGNMALWLCSEMQPPP